MPSSPASAPRFPTPATGSSSTSSRTSTRSSTSDPSGRRAGWAGRLVGLVRLVHPFPIAVDAGATTAIALVAGGAPLVALRLGIGMLALQAAIGALNDVVDAPRDAGLKPGKPIPAGLLTRRAALAVAGGAAILGLALSILSGPPVLALALAILGIGALYDLRLKGTAWSWLPFAIGIPLLPVYAWLGAAGSLPALFAVLVPVGVAAGAALAIANSLADVERDRAAGVSSVAARLGPGRARVLNAALQAVVLAASVASLVAGGAPLGWVAAGVGGAGSVVAVGVLLSAAKSPERRERGWELQALGIAVLAGTWFVLAVPR